MKKETANSRKDKAKCFKEDEKENSRYPASVGRRLCVFRGLRDLTYRVVPHLISQLLL